MLTRRCRSAVDADVGRFTDRCANRRSWSHRSDIGAPAFRRTFRDGFTRCRMGSSGLHPLALRSSFPCECNRLYCLVSKERPEASPLFVGRTMPRANILVVDDEKLIRWSMKQKLESWNYNVAEAEDLGQARLRLQQENPDLVTLDIKLPDGDGIDFLKQTRESHPGTPVIMVTAFGV